MARPAGWRQGGVQDDITNREATASVSPPWAGRRPFVEQVLDRVGDEIGGRGPRIRAVGAAGQQRSDL